MIVLVYILAVVNFICLSHIGLYTIGANVYDYKSIKKAHDQKKKLAKIKNPRVLKQKLVSVVIPAHNEEKNIKRTLDSVLANNYKNIEVLVVNDGSTDNTLKVARDYVKRIHSRKSVQVWSYFSRSGHAKSNKTRRITIHRKDTRMKVISQSNQGKASALNNAIKNHVRGQLVMTLDADSILHPYAIERSAAYFSDNKIIGLAANVRVMEDKRILSVLQRFEHLVGYRAKKMFSVTNCEYIIGGVASTYRRSVLKKVKFYDNDTMTEDIGLSLKIISKMGNTKKKVTYASDVLALTEGVISFGDLLRQRYRWKMGSLQNIFKYRRLIASNNELYSRTLTMYRLPMAIIGEFMLILEPILIAYIIYLSFHYHNFNILVGAYVIITIYILNVVWSDEHLSTKDKLKMSLLGLFIYLIFYIMDIVQIYSVIKTLRFSKLVINTKYSPTTWISPKRISQTT